MFYVDFACNAPDRERNSSLSSLPLSHCSSRKHSAYQTSYCSLFSFVLRSGRQLKHGYPTPPRPIVAHPPLSSTQQAQSDQPARSFQYIIGARHIPAMKSTAIPLLFTLSTLSTISLTTATCTHPPHPDILPAITSLCTQPPHGETITFPSPYASRGKIIGEARVAIQASCQPPEQLTREECMAQFQKICGFGNVQRGRGGCATFLIQRVRVREGGG